MKKLALFIALLVLLRPVLPVVEYVVNYDYITKVLCENKAKPQMQCNGKCHLMKQMAKAAEAEKPLQKDTKQVKIENEVLYCSTTFEISIKNLFSTNSSQNPIFYQDLYSFLKNTTIFHPPSI